MAVPSDEPERGISPAQHTARLTLLME